MELKRTVHDILNDMHIQIDASQDKTNAELKPNLDFIHELIHELEEKLRST